jgi:hypothetical protein
VGGGIRLHPKFGVNPSVTLCPICGESVGVALLGYNKDQEAPRQMVDPFGPCDKCKAMYLKDGVLILECERPKCHEEYPPRERPARYTGRLVVIKVEAWQRLFTLPVPPQHIAMMEPEAFQVLFGPEMQG